ncbi:hypothetical protein LguiA_035682 [Lonicera macranthoides]
MVIQRRRDFGRSARVLMSVAAFAFFIGISNGGELSESESLLSFIRAVDPENVLSISYNALFLHPCSYPLKCIKCNLRANTVIGIRLESMNLGGIIDVDSLCKLPNLRVLSLAKNQIQGSISESISSCTNLKYLNLSSNLLNGSLPVALSRMKNLRRLDISDDHFTANVQHLDKYDMESSAVQKSTKEEEKTADALSPRSERSLDDKPIEHHEGKSGKWAYLPLVIGIALFLLITYFLNVKATTLAKEKKILESLAHSPSNIPPSKAVNEPKLEEVRSELVFFVKEEEKFKMEDLLEATADLQSQGFCSSLYKVKLKNNAIYAVKRLKKLQVSFDEFGQTMQKIGELNHPNILPLVGYSSTSEEKLVIYRYQRNGSLLSLFENYNEGKRAFPWKHRLLLAIGIARGLEAIYQRSDNSEIIPHGNVKLSNILLNENEEPLISEYGYSKFQDPKTACLFHCNSYTAPEKSLSEQADVFSFGLILLELLTGKIVGKSGLDLPKWVKSIVREEWTGEVFDKEVAKAAMYAFPLLNISLKCVAHFPENRPSIAEVLEKIEEVVNAQDDLSPPLETSVESNSQDSSLLHSVVLESPGSNQ